MICEYDVNGGIRTADYWGWQWPLYQTWHHPCPHNLLKNLKQNHESAFPIIWWLFKSWKPGRNPLNNLQVCIYKSFLKSFVVTWVVKLYLLKLSQLKYPVLNTEDKFGGYNLVMLATTNDFFKSWHSKASKYLLVNYSLDLRQVLSFETLKNQAPILQTLANFEVQM